MIKGLNVLLALVCLLALVAVYALKYQTVDTANEKIALLTKIDGQQNQLSLLKADWAYLNQPGRIAPIIERHAEVLELQIAEQEQFISIASLPMRPASEPNDGALLALLEALENGVDPISALIEASQ
jgi:hypothetical protein